MAADNDSRQQQETYRGFMKLFAWSAVAVAVTLLLMLIFLA